MLVAINTFLTDYSAAVVDDNAALFIGAGMSRKVGFVDWKGLLTPLANELGVTITKSTDLVALAQKYINSKVGERSFLVQALLNEFDLPGKFERNHKIIAKLQIKTIWTTNYDELIEYAFLAEGKYLDVKIRDKDIGFSRKQCAAILYKMHGDISQPYEVTFCQEDYERYQKQHPVFQNTLTTALLCKTFCFLGLSFDDPNLNYHLGHLCTLLDNTKRVHYVVLRDARRIGELDATKTVLRYTESGADYEMRRLEQKHKMQDLQRYGIKTILVKCFEDVTPILELLDLRIRLLQRLKAQHHVLSDKELNEILDKHVPKFRHQCPECLSILSIIEP